MITIPANYVVQPLKSGEPAINPTTCGTCGLSWDDGKVTSMTPAPSARCPFETFHESQEETTARRLAHYSSDSTDDIAIDVDAKVTEVDDGFWVEARIFVHRSDVEDAAADTTEGQAHQPEREDGA